MKKLILLMLIIPVISNAQKAKNEIRRGNSEYRDENYSEAELHYRKALDKDPESTHANYNLGNALYKQKQYEPAVTKYESMLSTKASKDDMARYYYNLGDSYFMAKKLKEALKHTSRV